MTRYNIYVYDIMLFRYKGKSFNDDQFTTLKYRYFALAGFSQNKVRNQISV